MECYVRAGPQVHCIFVATAGGFQLPSRIDGAVSVGQYIRIVRLNVPWRGRQPVRLLVLARRRAWM